VICIVVVITSQTSLRKVYPDLTNQSSINHILFANMKSYIQ